MMDKSILVVEDDELNQRLICEYIKNMGYSINAVVDNYYEAISSVEANTPDLVLMDILLKGSKDGISVSRKIREKFDIPIIYLTSYAEDEVIERAKKTNPNGYILKPFKFNELKATINLALSNYTLSKSRESLSHEYEKAFKNLKCGIITTDNNGNVLFMNNIAELLTGYELSKVKHKFISEVLIFDYLGLTNQLLNEVKRKGSVYHNEDYLELVNRNGNKIRVNIKIGTQHIDEVSFITFLIWENTLISPTGAYEINERKKITTHNDAEINLMIISENALTRDGISKALNKSENIKIRCMVCQKLEFIECLNNNSIDIVVLNDDFPDSVILYDNIDFIKNINSEVKIVVTSKTFDEGKELKLLSLGVKGFVNTGEEGYDLAYSIHLVFNGDLWFRRDILNNYIILNLRTKESINTSIGYLTSKEKQIFDYINEGLSNKQISQKLAIGEKTVKNYINKINKKLGINIRKELYM